MSNREHIGELASFSLNLATQNSIKAPIPGLLSRMLLLLLGAKTKLRMPCKSRAPADQARQQAQAADMSVYSGRFCTHAALAPAPAPETIAPVPGSSDAGDGEAAASPPPVTDDADDAFAG